VARRLSSSVKVGIITLLLVAGGYAVWKTIGQTPSGASECEMWANFSDASGLPLGSKVVIAGLPVGEIADLQIDGRYARITMRVRDDMQLYDNAIAFKKSSSLLGSYYVEIDPGTAESVDARGQKRPNAPLKCGSQVLHVVEATSMDQLLRRVEETLPKVDSVLLSVRDLSEDVRSLVNGPLASMMARLDRLVQDQSDTVARSLENIESITKDVRAATQGAGAKVQNLLDNLEDASADAKAGVADARTLIKSAQSEVEQTGSKLREKLDSLDRVIDPTSEVMQKVNDPDKGTLGRLVGDTTIADNIEDITEDAKGFLGTLFGMQTYVGLRSEYNINAGDFRHYIAIELHTRPDKFYYIELEKGPRGRFPDISLVPDGMGGLQQSFVIEDKIRFTFQFAKRLDWLTRRFGLKESTGGVGADADLPLPWFDNSLKLSVDAFEAAWAGTPRLKLTAAYQMFGYLYILGGVDDVLIEPTQIPVTQNGLPDDVPSQLSEFHYGRDVFFGAMLKFNDLDLAALLTVGGALVTGAVQ
jgi:phospholipid/cholesterol/gamma-HCH transport system substrate-binding protein